MTSSSVTHPENLVFNVRNNICFSQIWALHHGELYSYVVGEPAEKWNCL